MKEVLELPERVAITPDLKAKIPRQIRYIIGNEGCERFSFYGMRNILTVFLVSSLLTVSAGRRSRAVRPRMCSTPSSSAFIFSRCWAAGWPIVSSANTTPSSG